MPRYSRWATVGVIVILLFIYLLFKGGAHLYTDWLWFSSLNYQRVYLTILLSEIGLRLAVGIFTFILFFLNLLFTRRAVLKMTTTQHQTTDGVVELKPSFWGSFINARRLNLTYFIISLIMAFLVSQAVTGDWMIIQKFLHPSTFGIKDPFFHRDLSFYIFQLPFYQYLYKLLIWLVLLVVLTVVLIYLFTKTLRGRLTSLFQSPSPRYHLSILTAVFFFILAWGYRLKQYSIFYSERGVVYGPGYTDIHANLLAYKIMFFIALLTALAILVNLFLRRYKLILYAVGFLVAAAIVIGGIYPTLVQKFLVVPNELEREKPFIENGIKYTRLAYGLDKAEKKLFPAGKTLTAGDILTNQETIKNIRLWDYRPLQQTYSQLQEIRLYYEFKDVDVDRYRINGRYQQVMLSARELNHEKLTEKAKTWVNQHLKYTHGYGITMSPVNEVTAEGLPYFIIKDIPPVTTTNLNVSRPEVYFGEKTDKYVVVNTKTEEFDYPKGEENAWSTYQAKNGVKINSFFRRLLFAISFGEYKLLLTTGITKDSQILYNRNISERVPKIAPFLEYDQDPYIVLSNGKLYWLWDAYTVSDRFPYAEPFKGRVNYIRNAVKVAVDAYTGEVTYYVADPNDPVLKTYRQIFPQMFVPLAKMPAGLQNHLRYPVDLFTVQAEKYATYHMQNYRVFYNKEDKWQLPTELFGREELAMEPYYTIARLPGEARPEFILIMPFTPQNKKNMIAWLAARSDGENYGKLLVYEFPKQELVYGPIQVEARINQDTLISQQISLWDQRGSEVIRGNLMVIPVKDALLYVEPLYLQAEQSKMPELRRVIVAHGEKVVMEPTLELALAQIFGKDGKLSPLLPTPNTTPGATPGLKERTLTSLAKQANGLYDEAQAYLREGNWTGYGEKLKQLKAILQEMADKA